jgi:hypothetical protein
MQGGLFKISAKIDTEKDRRRFRVYQHAMGQTIGDVLVRRARLLCVQLAFVTMPRGGGKKKGERALENDIRRLAKDFTQFQRELMSQPPSRWVNKMLRAVEKRDYATIADMIKNSKANGQLELIESFGREHHFPARVKGKVTAHPKPKFLVKNAASLRRYIQQERKMVGWAKGGWASAARDLGGTQGMPRWVSRHSEAPGSARITSWGYSGSVLIAELANNVRYIDEIMRNSALVEAEIDAARKFETHIRKVVKFATQKAFA